MVNENNEWDDQKQSREEQIEKPASQVIVADKKNSSLGLASLIAGITSLLSISCCAPLAFLLAIAAIILGVIARSANQDYATVGIILGIIGLIIPIFLLIFVTGFAFMAPLIETIF
ncbi:MAG: hypothetical protein R6U91_05185 [Bacillota bacterium]